MGLGAISPIHFRKKNKVLTDHANLKWLTSISPKQSKLAHWCLSMAEFDITIEHRAGSVHVVPDTLSRAPLPPPSTVDDYLIIPPVVVCSFLITALGYDIPGHTPQFISQVFDKTLHCLALSCDISPPSMIPPSPQVSPFKDDAPKHVSLPPVKVPDPPGSALWTDNSSSLHHLNITQFKFAKLQQYDKWLGPLIQYLISNDDISVLGDPCKKDQSWVISTAKRSTLIDGLLMHAVEFMDNQDRYRIFVPSDPALQKHVLRAYHDSPMGMHRGRDATYQCLSCNFYWCNMSKHERNWVCRCPHCIQFKSLQPAHGPMQIRLYQHPLHTLGVDYVGELPKSSSGNRWILTAVCPYSNYLRAIPVPDKTATTAAKALFNDVFLLLGFPSVLQSDRGGEFLNALLHQLTKLLSIKQVFTPGFRPCLNGATERTHCFLNSALGIYCEHHQEQWEDYLQSAVYAHNVAPTSGRSNITPFSLVFGCDALSPETISLELPPRPLPHNHYAKHILSRLSEAHKQFSQIKADICRQQCEIYDTKAHNLAIPDGKIVLYQLVKSYTCARLLLPVDKVLLLVLFVSLMAHIRSLAILLIDLICLPLKGTSGRKKKVKLK